MTWVRLDDGFFRHAKARAVGKDGRALFLAGLCHSADRLSDGHITADELPLVATMAGVRPSVSRRLVEIGLWEEEGKDFIIHDWTHYNPSATEVKERRERDRVRKESARNPHGQSADSAGLPDGIPPPSGAVPPLAGRGAAARARPGAGDGGSSIQKEVETALDAELAAKRSKGEQIASETAWKNWRRPTLVAELEMRHEKRLKAARRHGETMASACESDEELDEALTSKWNGDELEAARTAAASARTKGAA